MINCLQFFVDFSTVVILTLFFDKVCFSCSEGILITSNVNYIDQITLLVFLVLAVIHSFIHSFIHLFIHSVAVSGSDNGVVKSCSGLRTNPSH